MVSSRFWNTDFLAKNRLVFWLIVLSAFTLGVKSFAMELIE